MIDILYCDNIIQPEPYLKMCFICHRNTYFNFNDNSYMHTHPAVMMSGS